MRRLDCATRSDEAFTWWRARRSPLASSCRCIPCSRMTADVTFLAALIAGILKLPVALRAAAGAALSGLSGRDSLERLPTRRPPSAASARRADPPPSCSAAFDGFCGARSQRQRGWGSRFYWATRHRRRRCHHRHGPALSWVGADRWLIGRRASRAEAGRHWGAYSWDLRSRSAGRRASGQSWLRSWRSRRPRRPSPGSELLASTRRARYSLHHCGACGRAFAVFLTPFCRASGAHLERVMGGLLC